MKSDAELVREALSGRSNAYALLVHRWSARVLAVCHARVHNAAEAEDLAQDTLLRALRTLGTLRDPDRFGSWVSAIASRTCLDWLKSRKRSEVSIEQVGAAADRPHHQRDADREGGERLYSEIEQLPQDCRDVLMLYYHGNTTYQELGDMLGVSAATVNARLTKARQMLRKRLTETGN